MILKLGQLLGNGGFSNVYQVLDPNDAPLLLAVKKSHLSLLVRRSHLKYEGQLLQAFHGHPAIPRVVAYRPLKHFEYLAMELLGNTLKELTPKDGMDERIVAKVAVDMVRTYLIMIYRRNI